MVPKMNFDDIRPYTDSEVNHYIQVLINDPDFQMVLQYLFRDTEKIGHVRQMLLGIQTIRDLQQDFMYSLIEDLILKPTTSGLTCSGLENFDKSKGYLFISNHRDIILDSAILNYLIFREGMNTTEIAIGNNLFVAPWIEHAVKLNRAFVVRRNLPVRELLLASKKLSEYIRQTIAGRNTSVWIAQREGRTKDGFDKTQVALLKMLNLSNAGEFIDGFRELRIVPLSISYEIEPCGISKVEELYKRRTEGYEKTPEDDFRSMAHGLVLPKGRVHFAFGKPIDAALDVLAKDGIIGDQLQALAGYIDQRIYRNYKLWPNNYVAEDLLAGTEKNAANYTAEEKQAFENMLEEAVSSVDGDKAVIREMFLSMYANPVINQRSVLP